MHRPPPLLRLLPTATLLLLASDPTLAQDAEGAPVEVLEESAAASDDRAIVWSEWTPSIFAGIAISSSNTSSSVFAAYRNLDADLFALRDQREITLAGPVVPLGVELMAPSFRRLPGEPRLFLQGSYALSREQKNQLANSFFVQARSGAQPANYNAQLFGSFGPQLLGGLGGAFHFEVADYPVLFKPSLNFFAQEFTLDVVANVLPLNNVRVPRTARDMQWFYYVGPMLELGVEVGRAGPLGFQVFANTLVGFRVSDGDISLQRVFSNPAIGEPDDMFFFEYDSLVVNGGAGLRLVWYGGD